MTLKEFVFERMNAVGYISDAELARFCKEQGRSEEKDIPFYQAEVYKREYQNLKYLKERFDDCKNKVIRSYKNSFKGAKTKCYLSYDGMAENTSYKITKSYFNYLKDNKLAVLAN
jgi:competence CoiA-like predicted nuclease